MLAEEFTMADLSYRAVDSMFTAFYPNTAAGKVAWSTIAAHSDNTGKILTAHLGSTIDQLRRAGYTVAKASALEAISDDELLAALTPPSEAAD